MASRVGSGSAPGPMLASRSVALPGARSRHRQAAGAAVFRDSTDALRDPARGVAGAAAAIRRRGGQSFGGGSLAWARTSDHAPSVIVAATSTPAPNTAAEPKPASSLWVQTKNRSPPRYTAVSMTALPL